MYYRSQSLFTTLTDFGESAHSPSWSPDTLEIVFACGGQGQTDICVITLADGRIRKLTAGAAEDGEPDWAPDGSKILFSRDSLGDGGIWMMNPNGGDLEQIVAGKATSPSWAPDGREVYYLQGDRMMAVGFTEAGSEFTFEAPELLFEASYVTSASGPRNYDVAPDGRFLMLKGEDGAKPAAYRLHVVLNWFEELKRLVPTN